MLLTARRNKQIKIITCKQCCILLFEVQNHLGWKRPPRSSSPLLADHHLVNWTTAQRATSSHLSCHQGKRQGNRRNYEPTNPSNRRQVFYSAPSPGSWHTNATILSLNLVRHFRVTEWLRLEDTSVGQLVQPQIIRQGQLQQEAQDPIQTAFECLQGWRPHHLSVQPVQCSITHSKKKRVHWCWGKTLCFSLYPLLLVPSLCTTKKHYLCLLCTLLLFISTHVWRSVWTFSFLGWTVPALSAFLHRLLQSLHHFSGTLLDAVQQPHISLALGSPKLNTAPWVHLTRGGTAAPSACSSQVTLRGLCFEGTLLAHVPFAVPLAPRAFPEGWYPSMLLLLPSRQIL